MYIVGGERERERERERGRFQTRDERRDDGTDDAATTHKLRNFGMAYLASRQPALQRQQLTAGVAVLVCFSFSCQTRRL